MGDFCECGKEFLNSREFNKILYQLLRNRRYYYIQLVGNSLIGQTKLNSVRKTLCNEGKQTSS
jgi:hypothetical protein